MWMFTLLAFLTGSLLAFGLALFVLRSPFERRVARLGLSPVAEHETRPSLAARFEGWLAPVAKIAGGSSEDIRLRLVQAGYRSERATVLFLGGRLVAPVVGVMTVLAFGGVLGLNSTQRITAALLLAAIGYLGPGMVLDRIRLARQAAIRRALPDALDLMLVCLEAGLALGGALGRVARELVRTSPPLCEELRLVTREMQAGKSSSESLEAFAERVGTPEAKSLVAMLVQSERFGTGVCEALRVHTNGMRRDRLQKAEELAQKAAVKMIVPAAFFIFPATLLVILGPAGIRMLAMFADK